MIAFLFLLFIAGFLLQTLALRDGLSHVRFSYLPSVRETEPDAPFDVTMTLTNTGKLPIAYVKTEVAFPLSTRFPEDMEAEERRFELVAENTYRLRGREKTVSRMPIRIAKRGLHHFSGATLTRGDFLGMAEVSHHYAARSSVLVYPQRFGDTKLMKTLGKMNGDLIARQFLIRDPILTTCCREYTGQEPMHTISWIQTARLGELMVREFEPVRELSCGVIVLNDELGRDDAEILDLVCSLARTACEYLTEQGIIVDLYTNSPMSGYARSTARHVRAGRENVRDLLALLAALLPQKGSNIERLCDRALRKDEEAQSYLLIAARRSAGVLKACELLRARSGNEVELVVAEDYLAPAAEAQAETAREVRHAV